MRVQNELTQELYQVKAGGTTIGQTTAIAYGSSSLALAGANIIAELWAFGIAEDDLKTFRKKKCFLVQ